MQFQAAGASHAGRVRQANEDAWLTLGNVAVVADGMGGHACGEVASALAVDAFRAFAGRDRLAPGDVLDAIEQANRAIRTTAAQRPDRAGMGTTVTGIALVEEGGSPHWLVFNIGDSRVYRVVDGSVRQLTVDHSEVAELVAAGRLSATEARSHPLRNVVTRSLGIEADPAADTWLLPVVDGDAFVVCSDGLTEELSDAEIAAVIEGASSCARAADLLVDAAVAAGGHDNVTAVVVAYQTGAAEVDDALVTTRPRGLHAGGT